MPEPSQEAQRIVDFIRKSAGSRKAIVGLSGGIDSSVVYSLCIRALGGPERVIGLFLPPDARTPASDEEDVMELANSQKGTYRKVSIEPWSQRSWTPRGGNRQEGDREHKVQGQDGCPLLLCEHRRRHCSRHNEQDGVPDWLLHKVRGWRVRY
ncbi:hypothetical protein [Thermogymnomonas acidicola]|uniref:hypothetical protein n=1 Tax=Thermogymnomonas acidicola TaxID=399579 RepID=UPI0013969A14|nr:hypothetical protein [Thermogymnomonas acidicola]